MTEFTPFDPIESPLKGVNLIEASAGTGKTYALSGLFLRLVVEEGLSVQQILVVTFTEAATAELRERIRKRLREAMEAFEQGGSEDGFLRAWVTRQNDPSGAMRSLKGAIREFDKAAIFTIHGFCRRMLQENAFESGSLFDTELVPDLEELKRDIVEDFWRRHLYEASPLFVNYALAHHFSPDGLLKLLGHWVSLSYLRVIPQEEENDTSECEQAYCKAFEEVAGMWPSVKKEVTGLLVHDGNLNRNKYGKKQIPSWVELMDAWAATGPNPIFFKGFEKFTTGELVNSVKKNGVPPVHPFFEACERLKEAQVPLEKVFKSRLLALEGQLFIYARAELERRKQSRNIQSFDDLLKGLNDALEGKEGERLARSLGLKFKAALIDEFQDTDPLQYAIFKKLFGPAKCGLFLIGDPKQAIYGFRGADIFTYMGAARDATARYTLRENWRSEPALIRAVNTLFENSERPFVFEGIRYGPVSPAEDPERVYLALDGHEDAPLQLWFLDASRIAGGGKPILKTTAREMIPAAVAGEILKLIRLGGQEKALIGGRPLTAGDIAVLVRKNKEAHLIRKALSNLYIPSVLYAGGNLFDAHEALELERIMAAVVEPENKSHLRAALATDMLGVSGEALEAMGEDEASWEEWVVRFRAYRDLWKKRGFIQMFRSFLSKEGVLSRLMSLEEGERRNTNLLHLGEVLHQASAEKKTPMSGLLKWLSEQRRGDRPGRVEHPLRLESDENAVKLVTVHKSKGLEYPVVFCPFLWDGSTVRRSERSFVFHDRGEGMRLTLDLGSEEREMNRISAEEEILAENLRLLYVALTRARHRCYLVWGHIKETETSAPAYLFYPAESFSGQGALAAAREHFKKFKADAMVEKLTELTEKAGGAIRFLDMPGDKGQADGPSDPETPVLNHRAFTGKIDRVRGVSSFSSLISGRLREEETADRDATGRGAAGIRQEDREKDVQRRPLDIFSFPAGTKSGLFFHEIFENLDFTDPTLESMQTLVFEKLGAYGFEKHWHEVVCGMVKNVLSVPLNPGAEDFQLSSIENRNRLHELEFTFPLKTLSPRDMRALFAEAGEGEVPERFPETIGRLTFAPIRGFMKGFIDLIFRYKERFYLVDWKSNLLGKKVEDYGQEGLRAGMEEGLYGLQYHIYTLALNQYLQLRLTGYDYDRHFGGVFYIFIRGVDPMKGAEYGVFGARPSAGMIHALQDRWIDM